MRCLVIRSRARNLHCVVYPEDDAFVARCLDVEVASEGDTEEDAVCNLQEAVELLLDA